MLVLAGEDEAVVVPGVAPLASFGVLFVAPPLERDGAGPVELDAAAAAAGVRWRVAGFAVDQHEGLADGEATGGQVDVGPTQPSSSPRRMPVVTASSQAA